MSQLGGATRSAADVLGPALRHRVAVFRAREAEVRLDEPDAVHRFRVSARRLRSLVTAGGTLLDPARCAALDDELREAARVVGAARDAQVAQRRLESLLRDEPDSAALAQLEGRLTDLLERSYLSGWRQAIGYFDGSRYDAFTRLLDGFADLPPWTTSAQAPAGQVLVPVLRQEWTRLLSTGRRVQLLEPGPDRDQQLHAVRKAAKRVKDLAEVQASLSGRKVKRLRKAASRLQTVLGEHQDLVVTGVLLERLGRDGTVDHRVLHRIQLREAAAAGALFDDFVRTFREADRKSLRAWMR